MKKLSFILMLFPILADTAFSQNFKGEDYYQLYSDAAKEASLLFRGQQEYKYPYAGAYNGTYFWSTPVFAEGTLIYNGKYYSNLLLNINSLTETLLVKHIDGVVAIALNCDLVERFSIGQDQFVNLKAKGYDVEHNFYQILYSGQATFYKGVWKTEDTRNISANKMARTEGYNSKLTRAFVPYEEYYYEDETRFVKVRTKSSFINLYPNNKKSIKHYISSGNLRQKDFEPFCLDILNFMESANE